MSEEMKHCKRCGIELGVSILRIEGQEQVFNFLITKFSIGDLGKAQDTFNICNGCKKDYDDFMDVFKKTEHIKKIEEEYYEKYLGEKK